MKHDEAMYTFGIGENFHLQNYLGSHEIDGSEEGYVFRVWAPHAENVQVIGDFTGWFDEPLDMVKNHIGVWEVTSDLPEEGQLYKFWLSARVVKWSKKWILLPLTWNLDQEQGL